MTILDSGARRVFESGAVRDIQADADKGDCSLLPLDVVAKILKSDMLVCIEAFRTTGDVGCLYDALNAYCKEEYDSMPEMLLEVSKHFLEGSRKYSIDNWKKGIPLRSYIDSCVRHYLKIKANYTDESHTRAVTWNLICAIWTYINWPLLDDYTMAEGKADNVN